MPTDPDTALAELSDAIARDDNPGGALWSVACSQWDPYRGVRDDWAAIYNMWLLLGEHYRLKSFSDGTLARAGPRGRVGYGVNLLRYACFGIWCDLWGVTSWRGWTRNSPAPFTRPAAAPDADGDVIGANPLDRDQPFVWSDAINQLDVRTARRVGLVWCPRGSHGKHVGALVVENGKVETLMMTLSELSDLQRTPGR